MSGFLALVVAASVVAVGALTRAQADVCGDATQETGEQCDDGNTASGDGCSSVCMIERCGNSIRDALEQCDDGNTVSGDGCSSACFLEFCGDTTVSNDEQCDDGNRVSGDGCSSTCTLEEATKAPSPVTSPSPVVTPLTTKPVVTKPAVLPARPSEPVGILQELRYFTSPEGQDVIKGISDLSPEDHTSLDSLLNSLKKGKLSPEQRAEAERLIDIIKESLAQESEQQTKLLESLLRGETQEMIDALKAGASPLRGPALKSAVDSLLAHMQTMNPDLFSSLPQDLLEKLSGSPADVLAALLTVKQELQQIATTDLPASVSRIREQAMAIRGSISLLSTDQNIDIAALTKRLDALIALSDKTSPDTIAALVSANEKLMAELGSSDRMRAITRAEAESETQHAAARALRLAEQAGTTENVATPEEIRSFTEALAATAPEEYRHALETGSIDDQRAALTRFLEGNPEVAALRATLVAAGNTDMDTRYAVLLQDIAHLGAGSETVSPCDDDAASALVCIDAYVKALEEADLTKDFASKAAASIRSFFRLQP